jgi:hypothetical protein
MIKEIMEVPLPRADSKFLINLRIFHISTLLAASAAEAEEEEEEPSMIGEKFDNPPVPRQETQSSGHMYVLFIKNKEELDGYFFGGKRYQLVSGE